MNDFEGELVLDELKKLKEQVSGLHELLEVLWPGEDISVPDKEEEELSDATDEDSLTSA